MVLSLLSLVKILKDHATTLYAGRDLFAFWAPTSPRKRRVRNGTIVLYGLVAAILFFSVRLHIEQLERQYVAKTMVKLHRAEDTAEAVKMPDR